jgi:hypothetical protein
MGNSCMKKSMSTQDLRSTARATVRLYRTREPTIAIPLMAKHRVIKAPGVGDCQGHQFSDAAIHGLLMCTQAKEAVP